MCVVHLSSSFKLLGSFRESCFLSLRRHDLRTHMILSLMDSRGGIVDFQHCIDIAQGQEERIAITKALWANPLCEKSKNLHYHDFQGQSDV